MATARRGGRPFPRSTAPATPVVISDEDNEQTDRCMCETDRCMCDIRTSTPLRQARALATSALATANETMALLARRGIRISEAPANVGRRTVSATKRAADPAKRAASPQKPADSRTESEERQEMIKNNDPILDREAFAKATRRGEHAAAISSDTHDLDKKSADWKALGGLDVTKELQDAGNAAWLVQPDKMAKKAKMEEMPGSTGPRRAAQEAPQESEAKRAALEDARRAAREETLAKLRARIYV